METRMDLELDSNWHEIEQLESDKCPIIVSHLNGCEIQESKDIRVLLIWVVTMVLVYMALIGIFTRETEIKAEVMLITSGVLINIVMGNSLLQHGHMELRRISMLK